jgi:hypothetical protein
MEQNVAAITARAVSADFVSKEERLMSVGGNIFLVEDFVISGANRTFAVSMSARTPPLGFFGTGREANVAQKKFVSSFVAWYHEFYRTQG